MSVLMEPSISPLVPQTVAGWCTAILALPVLLIVVTMAYRAAVIFHSSWKLRHIPGPTPNLILGNLLGFMKEGGFHMSILRWRRQFGPIFKIHLLQRTFVVVAEPDACRTALTRYLNRPSFSNPTQKLLDKDHQLFTDEGLLHARDGLWRTLHKAWQPFFAPGSLAQYVALMDRTAQQLCDVLHKAADGGTAGGSGGYVELHALMTSVTLDVVGSCAYGTEFNALETSGTNQEPELISAIKTFFRTPSSQGGSKWGLLYVIMPTVSPLIKWLAHMLPDKALTDQIQACRLILGKGQQLISSWRAKAAANSSSGSSKTAADAQLPAAKLSNGKSSSATVQPGSFLDLMLRTQQQPPQQQQQQLQQQQASADASTMSDSMVLAQATTFILAGTETTANTVTYVVYLLSQHPQWQQRVLQEVDSIPRDRAVTSEDKLPVLEAVVNEALRLYPPGHATTRILEKKGGAQVGDYWVPDNTSLLMPFYTIHHDPVYWPRAEEFLPQRFLPEGEAERLGPRNPNAFVPFGGGPRMCTGTKFAQQEARILLVRLYQHFTFELAPGQVPLVLEAAVTLSPKHGVHVRPIPRL